MNLNILIFISCICLLFIIGRIFIVPIKWILKLVFNSVLGGILIWIINLIGVTWGFHIGLNLYTSILVRIVRNTRSNIFNCYKIFNNIKSPVIRMMNGAGWVRIRAYWLHIPDLSFFQHFL